MRLDGMCFSQKMLLCQLKIDGRKRCFVENWERILGEIEKSHGIKIRFSVGLRFRDTTGLCVTDVEDESQQHENRACEKKKKFGLSKTKTRTCYRFPHRLRQHVFVRARNWSNDWIPTSNRISKNSHPILESSQRRFCLHCSNESIAEKTNRKSQRSRLTTLLAGNKRWLESLGLSAQWPFSQ